MAFIHDFLYMYSLFIVHVNHTIETFFLRVAEDLEKHSTDGLVDPEDHLSNPVNSFLLVKRLTTDWQHTVNTLLTSDNRFSAGKCFFAL